MAENKTSAAPKMLMVICGVLLALAIGELVVRVFSIDMQLLRRSLYYQCSFLPLHRTSSDAKRLYELKPSTSIQGLPAPTHPKDEKYNGKINVHINALGFRGKSFDPVKKAGVFRIAIFGGSNTFGASVSDEDTYPAQMQKIFDKKYPGRVEVWNAGICAYVMSQDVAYAETVIEKFDPDLVILQDTNRGRRGFHYNTTFKELKRLFRENNELFIENIVPLWGQDVPPTERLRSFLTSTGSEIHVPLVVKSALYRAFCLSLYSCLGVFTNNKPIAPITEKYVPFWGFTGQIISNRELNLFTERHKNKKILLFFVTDFARKVGLEGVLIRENMSDFVLNSKGKPPEYQQTHPPSYVYVWYAQELCDLLVQKGYIPAERLQPKKPGSF